jgi:parallel beta-helix repeat protein
MTTACRIVTILSMMLMWLCLGLHNPAVASTWYFSPAGSDDAGNGSQSAPWNDPSDHNASYRPGDRLEIAPGTYNPRWGWALTASGSASGGYIILQCAPDHGSRIRTAAPFQAAIAVTHGGAFWDIAGCDVTATGMDGSAIAVAGGYSGPFGALHHVVIENNVVHDSSCNGIAVEGKGNSGQPVDYLIIRNNVVEGNAASAPRGCSGISIDAPVAYDNEPGYHLLLQQNIAYNNLACGTCKPVTTAGNGVVLDDFRHAETAGQPYPAASLVENNLIFNNGGNGIQVSLSDNVRVRHNTIRGNLQDRTHCAGGYEIGVVMSANIVVTNNIADATRARVCNGLATALYEFGGDQSTGDLFDWNLAHGVGPVTVAYDNSLKFAWGSHNLVGQDPRLAGPVTPTGPIAPSQIIAGFVPTRSSPALQHGTPSDSPATDLVGTRRRVSGAADLGAIQVGP